MSSQFWNPKPPKHVRESQKGSQGGGGLSLAFATLMTIGIFVMIVKGDWAVLLFILLLCVLSSQVDTKP